MRHLFTAAAAATKTSGVLQEGLEGRHYLAQMSHERAIAATLPRWDTGDELGDSVGEVDHQQHNHQLEAERRWSLVRLRSLHEPASFE